MGAKTHLTKSTPFHDKNTQQTRNRKNVSQLDKKHL